MKIIYYGVALDSCCPAVVFSAMMPASANYCSNRMTKARSGDTDNMTKQESLSKEKMTLPHVGYGRLSTSVMRGVLVGGLQVACVACGECHGGEYGSL